MASPSRESLEDSQTIFTALPGQFPNANSTDKICTSEFLQAVSGLLLITEKIGKVFAPVIYDVKGNIKKISDRLSEDPECNKFLEDMILRERMQREVIATDAVMWLRRDMDFISTFFEFVIKDTDSERCKKELSAFIKKAYTESLEPFHGWLGTQLYNVLSRFCPNRKSLLFIFALESHNKEGIVLRDMRLYTLKVKTMIARLKEFYNQHNLETSALL